MPVVTAAAFILGALTASLAWWMIRRRPDVLEQRERRQWVVTLKTGSAFRGVLTDHDRACLVLSDAEHLSDEHSPVPVDGEVIVLLVDVKYAQRL
jgi:small nuclear ribonucleoprotein (snRNP)-like protein